MNFSLKGPSISVNKTKDKDHAGVELDLHGPKVETSGSLHAQAQGKADVKAPQAQVEVKPPKAQVEFEQPQAKVEVKPPKAQVEFEQPQAKVEVKPPAPPKMDLNIGLGVEKPQVTVQGRGELRDPVGAEFHDQCLQAHNIVREAHGVPPLRSNPELVASAQRWVDELARTDKFEHSSNRPDDVGENIGMKWESTGTIFTGNQATQQWYDEIDQYTFQGEENLACGHFSQVVWKATSECGFAKAMTKDGKLLVVGHYAPAGNYVGEWAENVHPPKSGVKVQLPDWPVGHPSHAVSESQKQDSYKSLDKAFAEELLKAHNQYRKKHAAEDVQLDNDLSVIAQQHADFLAQNHRFEHSRNRYKGGIIGENIACKVISLDANANDYSAQELLDVWYSEESQYEYDGQSPKLSAGHFTQIVWKNTKVIGVGKAIDQKDSKVVVVVNYHPAGNILKRFRENVSEPKA